MLRKEIILGFLVLLLALILSSCSSNPGNSTTSQNIELGNNDPDNCIRPCKIVYKNMEAIFKDNNRELFSIKKFFLDLRNNDTKHITDCFSKDIQLFVLGKAGAVPLAGTYNGKESVKGYLNAWYSSFSTLQMIFQYNLVDEIDRNMVNTHVQAIAQIPSSGKTLNIEILYSWRLNNEGKIKSLFVYYDTYSWWLAFQPGGPKYVEDTKGTNKFDLHEINYDVRQIGVKLYAAFNTGAGSLPDLLSLLDNDFDFIIKGDPSCVFPGAYHGIDGFMQFLYKLFNSIYYGKPLYDEYLMVQGNCFDYHGIETVVCAATGKMWSADLIHSVIVGDNGKLIELKSYNDSFGMYEAFQP